MKEVNDLLNRLGEMEEAPLIWINKKVYDMAEEIERLKEENRELQHRIEKALRIIQDDWYEKNTIPIWSISDVTKDIRIKLYYALLLKNEGGIDE